MKRPWYIMGLRRLRLRKFEPYTALEGLSDAVVSHCLAMDMEGLTLHIRRLERKGEVTAKVIPNTTKETLHSEVKKNVEKGAKLFTDSFPAYEGLSNDYLHEMVDHAVQYVNGRVRTNGIENFWSLLKRSIKGTYVSVDPEHLTRYVDEQAFRFNSHKGKDADRFVSTLGGVEGRRVTYKELIGKGEKRGG